MEKKSFFADPRWLLTLTLLILFSIGLAIRIYDLTDPPLDFHPTRQLFSAIKARGMYYEALLDVPAWQRQMAIQQMRARSVIEPEILERLAAFTYRFTGEQLWVPRLYSSIFWLIGGVFLFLLARDLVSTAGAVLSLAYFLFLPYAIAASRSFQPDPLMIALILAFWWLIYRWAASARTPGSSPEGKGENSWKWAILAGFIGGLAILIKLVAAFFVIGGALAAALSHFKLRDILRNPQTWTMALLGIMPGGFWVVYGVFIAGFLGQQFNGRSIPALLLSPSFYVNWQTKAAIAAGGIWIMFGLLGLFLVREKRVRGFLLGLWGSYLVFGLFFDYHISTHDYYSLPLIAIVALSLAAVGDGFFARLTEAGSGWVRGAVFVILLYGLFSTVWAVRDEMKAVDYRPRVAFWQEISAAMGPHASLVALTDDYGSQLAYYGWQTAENWPTSGDLYQTEVRGGDTDFHDFFVKMTQKKIFFLITDLQDFKRQPDLQKWLGDYPVWAQGDGYIIYDLYHPLGGQ